MSRIERLQFVEVEPVVAPRLSSHASAAAFWLRVVLRMGPGDCATPGGVSGAVVTRTLRARIFAPLTLLVVVSVFVPVMSGCAVSPVGLMFTSDAEIQSISSMELARAYDRYGSKRCREELERRAVFTDAEWAQIDNGQIHTGDTQLLVMAAWGMASSVSTTITDYGTVEVWGYGTVQYVTFRDGLVTAIHNYPY